MIVAAMLTKPWDKDSRLILLLLTADGVEVTGRMLAAWWRLRRRSHKLAHQLRVLTLRGCVRAGAGPLDERLLAITDRGSRVVWGDVDPEARWARKWDRTWRLVLFDVPQAKASLRTGLRRQLRALHFGWLQNSVWVSPDPVDAILPALVERQVSVESLLFIDGRPAAGETDVQLVTGAWDFARLAKMHADYLKVLRLRPTKSNRSSLADWANWLDVEHRAWREIVRLDPLLPSVLHPPGYAGPEVWRARKEALQGATSQVAAAFGRG